MASSADGEELKILRVVDSRSAQTKINVLSNLFDPNSKIADIGRRDFSGDSKAGKNYITECTKLYLLETNCIPRTDGEICPVQIGVLQKGSHRLDFFLNKEANSLQIYRLKKPRLEKRIAAA